jgi:DNA polymerase III delta prime subunit
VPREFLALVSLHSGHYNKTPPDRWGLVEASHPWKAAELPVDALLEHILAGRAWLACQLHGGKRNEDNAGPSNLIVLDIDGDLTLDLFWANPFAARHCLLTYTSCSHSPGGEHRFRALFPCEQHEGGDLHRSIYRQVLDALGLALKDDSGAKPERLWYGNTNAEVRFGAGEPLSWDLIECARDELAAELERRNAPRPETTEQDQRLDNERAAFCLLHLLQASSDGEFQSYWSPLLNAAAATGSDLVREAFLQWHYRGHHGKSQRGVEKRFSKAGTKITPGQGAGQILSFAKQQHGSDWWRQLPEHLWFGGGGSPPAKPPTVLMRARSAADIAPAGGTFSLSSQDDTAVPDLVPSPAALEQLAKKAPVPLMQTKRGESASTQPISESAHIEQLLCRIYYLETERIDLGQQGEEVLSARMARYRIDQLESELLNYQAFRSNPQRIRTRLLQIFCDHNAIIERDSSELVAEPPLLNDDISNDWLVDRLMLQGASYLLYSPAGVGKTTFALLIARAVMGTPGHDNLLNHKVVPPVPFSQSRVLYIASDGNLFARGDINNYLNAMQQQGQEWIRYLHILAAKRNDKAAPLRMNLQGFHLIVKHLDAYEAAGTPVTTLIVDSLKACMPENMLVGDQGVTALLRIMEDICEKRGITLIYLHHQSKESEQPQGVAGLTEMVHGYFRLKQNDEGQRFFCVMKTRDGKGGKREIPYGLDAKNALVTVYLDDDAARDPLEAALLNLFSNHYAKHLSAADGDPSRLYQGIQRSDLLLLLRECGPVNPAWRTPKVFDKPIARLCAEGRLKRIEHGRYAIGHAKQHNPIEQSALKITYLDDEPEADDHGYGFV